MRALPQDNRSGSWSGRGRRPLLTPGLCDRCLIDLPTPCAAILRRSLLEPGLPAGRAYAFSHDAHIVRPPSGNSQLGV